jgi:hypothetical protein
LRSTPRKAAGSRPVSIRICSAYATGPGATILAYDRSRQLWEENRSFRMKFGLYLALLGLALGGIHLWKTRRRGAADAA